MLFSALDFVRRAAYRKDELTDDCAVNFLVGLIQTQIRFVGYCYCSAVKLSVCRPANRVCLFFSKPVSDIKPPASAGNIFRLVKTLLHPRKFFLRYYRQETHLIMLKKLKRTVNSVFYTGLILSIQ